METNKQMACYKSHACVLRVTENGQPEVSLALWTMKWLI